MKKPSVSKSKKGAIFNILWLLIENPKKLKYFRQVDIKNQLFEEFGIALDRKTIQDYLDILIELNLPFELSHENNKGYYISKGIISDREREILLHAFNELKGINQQIKNNLFNYLTYDCSREMKKHYFNKRDLISSNIDINIIENIEIIQKAIEEKRSISFEYLNFNRYGELMNDARTYKVIPQRIEYKNGMFYLYNAEKFWDNIYCGTKIKYMRNIKLGDYHNNPKLHEKYDFSFEVKIIYDWSIEFIVDHFDNYQIIRDKSSMKAEINAPYEFALDWCKKYAAFFIIDDKIMKNAILEDMKLLISYIEDKDEFILKIKSAIADYHYQNPLTESSSYSSYINGLYKQIDFYLDSLNYKLVKADDFKYYFNGLEDVCISCVEKTESHPSDIVEAIASSYNKLITIKAKRKIIIVLYDDISEDEETRIKEILKIDTFINIQDKFSKCNASYFYKYSVIEID